MSHRCPHCHGTRFVAARLEGAENLGVVLEDGRRWGLKLQVCDDCGLVEILAPHESSRKGSKPDEDVQQADF